MVIKYCGLESSDSQCKCSRSRSCSDLGARQRILDVSQIGDDWKYAAARCVEEAIWSVERRFLSASIHVAKMDLFGGLTPNRDLFGVNTEALQELRDS